MAWYERSPRFTSGDCWTLAWPLLLFGMGTLKPGFEGADEVGKADAGPHGDTGLGVGWLCNSSSWFSGGPLPGSKKEKKL